MLYADVAYEALAMTRKLMIFIYRIWEGATTTGHEIRASVTLGNFTSGRNLIRRMHLRIVWYLSKRLLVNFIKGFFPRPRSTLSASWRVFSLVQLMYSKKHQTIATLKNSEKFAMVGALNVSKRKTETWTLLSYPRVFRGVPFTGF